MVFGCPINIEWVCSVSLIDWKWGIIHGLADVYQNDVLSALLTGSRLAHLCNRPFWRGFDPPATLPMTRKGRRWQQPHLHAATVNLNDTTHLFCTIATLCSSTSPSILRHICYGVDDRRHMVSCLLTLGRFRGSCSPLLETVAHARCMAASCWQLIWL